MRRFQALLLSSLFALMAIGFVGCGGSEEIEVPVNPAEQPDAEPTGSAQEGDTPPPL
ncbi:hypothetical protein OAH18_01455 [bacterium]|nr:hypothetical protein [bacterium]